MTPYEIKKYISCSSELLSNKSLFGGQLYTTASDISTYNWQTNSDLLLNNSLLELIYFYSNTQKKLENEFSPSNSPNF